MYNKKKVQRFQGVRGPMHAFGQMYNFFCECTLRRKCTGKSDSRARKSKSRRGRQQKIFLSHLLVQPAREGYTIYTWRLTHGMEDATTTDLAATRRTSTRLTPIRRNHIGSLSVNNCGSGVAADALNETLLDSPRRNTRWEELSTLSGPINYAIGRRLEKYFSQCTSGEKVRVPTASVTTKV